MPTSTANAIRFMAYQVIARKYRPQRFSEVVGQEHVTRTLTQAILQNRIAHAYLFCGPRGTGKTTIARIFAKCLNCTQGPSVDFSDDDPRCREITEGRSLDVLEIDGASNRGIDEIRELRDTVRYAPATSRFKVYIIDEVHMLTKEAFNALLKTLEEPPEHVKFMFATTEPEKVLPTILSRCQRFDLQRIPIRLIVQHLAHIARLEGVTIEEPALFAIARGADGGLRDAESTLDQLISFCGQQIHEGDVLSMFGLAAQSQLLDLTDALIQGDFPKALDQLNDLAHQGKELNRLIAELLNHFRNLLIFQVAKGDLGLLEVSESEAEILGRQAKSLTTEALARMLDILTDCETRMRDAVSRKILVEITLYRLIQARHAVEVDALLAQLKEWRTGAPPAKGASQAPTTSAPPPAPNRPSPAPRASDPPPAGRSTEALTASPPPVTPTSQPLPAGKLEGDQLNDLWQRLLEGSGRSSPFVRSYLTQAFPVAFNGKLLTIGFDPSLSDQLGLVDTPKSRNLLQSILAEIGAANTQVRFVTASTPTGIAAKPTETPPVQDTATLIQSSTQERGVPPGSVTSSSSPGISIAGRAKPEPPTPLTATASAAPPSVPVPVKAKTEPEKLDPAQFKNDPLIQTALEIFKGHLVEVRNPPKS